MFNEFSDGPRTWKWAVPGACAIVLLFFGVQLTGNVTVRDGWRAFGVLLIVLGLFCGLIARDNRWRFITSHKAEMLKLKKEADAITPRSQILHESKSVHPDTLRLILGEMSRRWGLVSGAKSATGEPYAVLMSRPRVTQAFLVYFLRMSNEQTYMPKRKLSENDHSFDPQKVVTAYEMHDDLESLLVEELKATKPLGDNKPGYWLGEWDPYSVGKDFGVDINEWDLDDVVEESPASRIARGGTSSNTTDVMAKALEGLEQTKEMKARNAQALKS